MNIEEIQKALIGRLLTDGKRYVDVADSLTADDFPNLAAQNIWLSMAEVYKTQDINLQNIYLWSDDDTRVWLSGISEWLTPGDVVSLAEIVKEYSKRNRILRDLESAKKAGESEDILNDLSRIYWNELGETSKDVSISPVLKRFNKIQEDNKNCGHLGIDTGFSTLDRDHINFRKGHFWAIGGWTSVGKTAVLVEFLKRLSRDKVAVFSTEMTEEQIVARLLANMTGINSNGILAGNLINKHKKKIDGAKNIIEGRDLWIYDNIRTTKQIAKEARRLKMKEDIEIIFIDYFQQLDMGNGKRYEVLSEAANNLQDLAKELRCHIVVFSQIPNQAAKEDSGILEFKGAGELAACVDVGVWMSRAKEDKRIILFDIRKNRHGPLKKMILKFDDGYTCLDDTGETET